MELEAHLVNRPLITDITNMALNAVPLGIDNTLQQKHKRQSLEYGCCYRKTNIIKLVLQQLLTLCPQLHCSMPKAVCRCLREEWACEHNGLIQIVCFGVSTCEWLEDSCHLRPNYQEHTAYVPTYIYSHGSLLRGGERKRRKKEKKRERMGGG